MEPLPPTGFRKGFLYRNIIIQICFSPSTRISYIYILSILLIPKARGGGQSGSAENLCVTLHIELLESHSGMFIGRYALLLTMFIRNNLHRIPISPLR